MSRIARWQCLSAASRSSDVSTNVVSGQRPNEVLTRVTELVAPVTISTSFTRPKFSKSIYAVLYRSQICRTRSRYSSGRFTPAASS